jgi:hypothetical protein
VPATVRGVPDTNPTGRVSLTLHVDHDINGCLTLMKSVLAKSMIDLGNGIWRRIALPT